MSDLAPVRPKLALLIPRLASTFDGEIVATVRAIERTLAGAGLDLHDLARGIEAGPVGAEPTCCCREEEWEWNEDWHAGTWASLANYTWSHKERLASHERKFISDVRRRLTLHMPLSERQVAWLKALHDRTFRGRR